MYHFLFPLKVSPIYLTRSGGVREPRRKVRFELRFNDKENEKAQHTTVCEHVSFPFPSKVSPIHLTRSGGVSEPRRKARFELRFNEKENEKAQHTTVCEHLSFSFSLK